MLFAFRSIRFFQALLAVIAIAMGIGAALFLKAFSDGQGILMLLLGGLFGLIFLWAFATTLQAPTSFVAIADERTRIRFAGFVDTVIANNDVLGCQLARRNILGGVGVRTNFRGEVALASTWGVVAELHLRNPVRIWLIPRLWPVRAHRLQVSVRHPEKLVERFGPPREASSPASHPNRKMKRRGSRTR